MNAPLRVVLTCLWAASFAAVALADDPPENKELPDQYAEVVLRVDGMI